MEKPCFAEKPLLLKPKDVSEAVKYIVWFFRPALSSGRGYLPLSVRGASTTNCVRDVFPVFFPKPCAKAKHRNLQVTRVFSWFWLTVFCIKIPMFFVLVEKPISSKFYLLFAGNNFSIRWKKSALQTQEKTPLPSSVFLHIYALFIVEI